MVARHGPVPARRGGPHGGHPPERRQLDHRGRGAGQPARAVPGAGAPDAGAQRAGQALVRGLHMPCGWGLQARRGPDACGRATQSCGRNEIRARGGCFDGNAGAQGGGGPRRGRGEAGSLAAGLGPRGGRRHLAGALCPSGAARGLSVPRLRRGAVAHHGAADAAGSRGVVPQGHGRLGQAQTDPHPARPRPGGVRPRERRRPPGAATAARHAAQRGLLLGLQRGAHRRAGRCGGLAGAGAGGRHGPAVCGCGRVHGGRALAMGRCVAHHLGLEGNCAGGGGARASGRCRPRCPVRQQRCATTTRPCIWMPARASAARCTPRA